MNRKELLELALKETGSLTQAIELVKQWDSLSQVAENIEGLSTLGSNIILPVPASVCEDARKVLEIIDALAEPEPTGTKKKTLSKTLKSRKRWSTEDVILAESMFDNGMPIAKVAHALDRTEKSIRDALRIGAIKPNKDPRNPKLRAAAMRGTLARGNELSNYAEAQKLIDAH